MKLSFYGGAGEVTGSNFLLEKGDEKILIDCGLFQGDKFAEGKNFEALPYEPARIQAVLVTHAHLDHIGRLPLLVKQGFKGQIVCTKPTRDLISIALLDSQEILASEAREDAHEALYAQEDVLGMEDLIRTVDYEEEFVIGSFRVKFFDAGHILGSAMIKVHAEGKTIVFSGDVGNVASALFNPPTILESADYIILESVYGDRLHNKEIGRRDSLEDIIEETLNQNGVLMIPAFALERTQDILYDIDALISQGRIPKVPVFVDSPLAIKATSIYKAYPEYYAFDVQQEIKEGETMFQFPGLIFAQSVEESKSINKVVAPKIIIAGSGMSQGGRILHHERRYLSDPASTLLVVGYQAQGSRGRHLLSGASSVRIFGETIPIRCSIRVIDGYSAHADREELLEWVRPFKNNVQKVFLVHGESEASQALSYELADFLGTEVVIPHRGDEVELV